MASAAPPVRSGGSTGHNIHPLVFSAPRSGPGSPGQPELKQALAAHSFLERHFGRRSNGMLSRRRSRRGEVKSEGEEVEEVCFCGGGL